MGEPIKNQNIATAAAARIVLDVIEKVVCDTTASARALV